MILHYAQNEEGDLYSTLQKILPRGPEASRILNEEERTWLLRRRAMGLNYAARKHPTKSGLLCKQLFNYLFVL